MLGDGIMNNLHFLYPEDNKALINSIRVLIDDKEYILKKRVPQIIEVSKGNHHVVVYGAVLSNVDVSFSSGNVSGDVSSKEWYSGDILIEENDEYYMFKTPFLVNFKGKLKKVSKDEFDKKCI